MKRFSKSILLTILVLSMVFIFVGCKSAKVEAEEPVEVSEPVKTEEPKAEEPKAEEPAPVSGITKTYTIAGYEIKVDAEVGKATITYPTSIITEADLLTALTYVQANYGAYLDGITYDYKPGKVVLTYPASFTADDFAAVEMLGSAYINAALAAYATEPITATTEVVTTASEVVTTEAEPVAEAPALVYEISYAGYKATVT